ncbi:hypothetical protein LY622_22150 [Halomonas sp. M5N1S17]|uniref:hypothetical protein n=1 Tax=Halomonas alkalisoli TaxID=2907158 RepID=UPI001F2B7DBE|nr:hypothetical protein [Halomonas alkalisoli]MCE9666135.1 hypothetical protein [Halomonas alkalisoli]
MEAFVAHVAKVLNFNKLSKGTIYNLMKDYPEVKQRVEAARERYRDQKDNSAVKDVDDQLLNEAREQVKKLKAEVGSLKKENSMLQEKIIQMLYNAYYEKVNISNLKRPVDRQEAVKALSERASQEKVAFFDQPLPPK